MDKLDNTRHCPMCEDAAKKILELEHRVKVLTNVLKRASKSLGAFCGDEGWGMQDMNTMDDVDAVLAFTPQQTAAQIERWHIEWMMNLVPSAHMFPSALEKFQYQETYATAYSVEVGSPTEESVPLFAIPPLPKESKS